MAKFARLIEIENDEQVLLTIEYNDEDDKYEVAIRTDLDGITAQIKLGFAEEEQAVIAMNKYGQPNAQAFREEMEKMLL